MCAGRLTPEHLTASSGHPGCQVTWEGSVRASSLFRNSAQRSPNADTSLSPPCSLTSCMCYPDTSPNRIASTIIPVLTTADELGTFRVPSSLAPPPLSSRSDRHEPRSRPEDCAQSAEAKDTPWCLVPCLTLAVESHSPPPAWSGLENSTVDGLRAPLASWQSQ